ELDITSAAIELVLTFVLAKRFLHSTPHNRNIGVEKCVSDLLDEGKSFLAIAFQIIEKQAADAAHFVAVLQCEVLIAPLLELRVKMRIVTVAYRFDGAMKVDRVFCKRIARRQVHAAAKPGRVAFLQVSEV